MIVFVVPAPPFKRTVLVPVLSITKLFTLSPPSNMAKLAKLSVSVPLTNIPASVESKVKVLVTPSAPCKVLSIPLLVNNSKSVTEVKLRI